LHIVDPVTGIRSDLRLRLERQIDFDTNFARGDRRTYRPPLSRAAIVRPTFCGAVGHVRQFGDGAPLTRDDQVKEFAVFWRTGALLRPPGR